VQGFGNVGSHVAKILARTGASMTAVGDWKGYISNGEGINPFKLSEYVQRTGSVVGYPGTHSVPRDQFFSTEVDIFIPAALELEIGVPEAHHPLSHHGNEPELIARMSKINRYHTQLFSQYLAKLRATPDGDGSLLDHMTILYGSGISNSNQHSGDNLPLLVMGGGAGRLRGGQHLVYSDKPTMANLLVTLMDKLDVPVDHVGGSTGRLPIDTLGGL
jgi:hypothetical protein